MCPYEANDRLKPMLTQPLHIFPNKEVMTTIHSEKSRNEKKKNGISTIIIIIIIRCDFI